MARIAIDARIISTSTGRYIERLVTYLQDIDKENKYLVLVKKNDLDYWKPKQKNFKVVEANFREFRFGEQIGFLKFLNELNADLVHFGMPHHPILYRRLFVVTIHDMTMFSYKNETMSEVGGASIKNPYVYLAKLPVFKYVLHRAARASKAVIVPTKNTKKELLRYTRTLDPEKIKITYESADKIPAKAEPIKGLEGKPYISFVGRAWPYKNVKTLIDGYAIAKKDHPDLQLVLAGKKEAHYDALEAYADEKGIKDVHFPGFISEGQLRWLYENALAHGFPSISEGFGLPAVEAMMHGVPVVSSNSSCGPEVIGGGGLYFDPYEPRELAERIKELINDPALREKISKAGLKKSKEYSWAKMARETHEIYMDALKR